MALTVVENGDYGSEAQADDLQLALAAAARMIWQGQAVSALGIAAQCGLSTRGANDCIDRLVELGLMFPVDDEHWGVHLRMARP